MRELDSATGRVKFYQRLEASRCRSIPEVRSIEEWAREHGFDVRFDQDERRNILMRLAVCCSNHRHESIRLVTDLKLRVHARNKKPPFDTPGKRDGLLDRFSKIRHVNLQPPDWRSRTRTDPHISLNAIDEDNLPDVIEFLKWYRDTVIGEG